MLEHASVDKLVALFRPLEVGLGGDLQQPICGQLVGRAEFLDTGALRELSLQQKSENCFFLHGQIQIGGSYGVRRVGENFAAEEKQIPESLQVGLKTRHELFDGGELSRRLLLVLFRAFLQLNIKGRLTLVWQILR